MNIKYIAWLFAITSSLAGVQFVYSLQFAAGVPLFKETFKLSLSTANIILATSGPISGFLVQPIVGVMSDNSRNGMGRRRPFVLAGTILTAIGMALLACSAKLGNLMGDIPDGPEPSDHKAGLSLAVIGLWIMNLFTNVMQGPARALINDIVDKEYLQTGNAIASAIMAAAAVIGSVIGAQTTAMSEPFFILLLIGAGLVLLACIPTMFAAREEPYVLPAGESPKTVGQVFGDIFRGFKYAPRELLTVAGLYFLSWCAYSPLMVNMTDYVRGLFKPGPNDPNNMYGLQIAFYASAIFSAVQFLWSLIQPAVIKLANPKLVYLASQFLATAVYTALLVLKPWPAAAIAVTAVAAINFAAFNSIPFALVSSITAGANGGLYMGVLNSAAVVSQVISINAVAAPVMNAFGDSAWGIASGSIFGLLALVWGMVCVHGREEPEKVPDERRPLIQHIE